ncbi:TPA: pilus assembly protein [Vibrio vulnificus]|uniref:TadE family protein n=1 Tax=Vibrio vulnificus TaxID=672 RepID=UPI0005F17A6D|nr:TadE family protein [Vibrio vulnificus]MCG6314743.1 pilus assembly protein [Vibrio vulnificus]HAS6363363.1 pilus assembly protein [Vibrio vulnificus]HDY7544093.1 pilus assembly protein [Vibrio vulnificus]HDY7685036.1 pilus assembly protein [Vibrio vulnificus]
MKGHKGHKGQIGSVSVEAALIMPVLLALVVLFFEVGRVQWHFSALDHAIQQARRATQLKQVADPNALIEHFSQQLQLHSPDLARHANIESQLFASIAQWLGAAQRETVQQGQLQHGVIVITVSLELPPLAIPLLTDQEMVYRYRNHIALIPEKAFETD